MLDLAEDLGPCVATARGTAARWTLELRRLKRESEALRAGIQACVAAGERETALALAERLASALQLREDAIRHCLRAESLRDSLAGFRSRRVDVLRTRADAALGSVPGARAQSWRSRLAEAFERAEVSGVDLDADELARQLRPGQAEPGPAADVRQILEERRAVRRAAEEQVRAAAAGRPPAVRAEGSGPAEETP